MDAHAAGLRFARQQHSHGTVVTTSQHLTRLCSAVALPAAIIVAILAIVLVLSYMRLPPRLQLPHLRQQLEAPAPQPGKAEAPLQPLFREMPVVLLQQDQQVKSSYASDLRRECSRSCHFSCLLAPCPAGDSGCALQEGHLAQFAQCLQIELHCIYASLARLVYAAVKENGLCADCHGEAGSITITPAVSTISQSRDLHRGHTTMT